MTKEEKEITRWLKSKHSGAERDAKRYARAGDYGNAGRAVGRAEAYAFAFMHVEVEARNRKSRERGA